MNYKLSLIGLFLLSLVGCVEQESYSEYCSGCRQILEGKLDRKSVICYPTYNIYYELEYAACGADDVCSSVCNDNFCSKELMTNECHECVEKNAPKEYKECMDNSYPTNE